VKLDFLEALLRPVEHLDKRKPCGTSRLGADHQGCVIDQFEEFASVWYKKTLFFNNTMMAVLLIFLWMYIGLKVPLTVLSSPAEESPNGSNTEGISMTNSMETQEFYFRKTKANGDLAGTTRSVEVPTFDWEAFKNTPNVELFVRRAYQSLLQKLVRDMKQGNKNVTRQKDLISMEAVTTRSFQFNKADIKNQT
jgi:hypothetical protein